MLSPGANVLNFGHESAPKLLVGCPGLDPGTLGLKEGYEWSDPSGGVGFVRKSRNSCPVVSDLSGGVGLVRGNFVGFLSKRNRSVWGFEPVGVASAG